MSTLTKSIYGINGIPRDDNYEGDEHPMTGQNPEPPAGGSDPLALDSITPRTYQVDVETAGSRVGQAHVDGDQREPTGADTSATGVALRMLELRCPDVASCTTTHNPRKHLTANVLRTVPCYLYPSVSAHTPTLSPGRVHRAPHMHTLFRRNQLLILIWDGVKVIQSTLLKAFDIAIIGINWISRRVETFLLRIGSTRV